MLSKRQIQVLDLVNKGTSRREIANTLKIAFPTVAVHLNNIYKKLNVSGPLAKAKAIKKAQKLKLI